MMENGIAQSETLHLHNPTIHFTVAPAIIYGELSFMILWCQNECWESKLLTLIEGSIMDDGSCFMIIP